MATLVDILVITGRMLWHMKGAWKCTCQLSAVLDIAQLADEVAQDTGL